MGGIYNGDPDVGLANRYGLDFTFKGPAYGIAEVGWRRNQGIKDTGLPGNLKFGGFVLGGRAQTFDSASSRGGRFGLYVVGDQALVRFGDANSGRHLGVFGSFVMAPDESVSPMPYYFSAGLVAYGPLDFRPKDFLSVGVAYGAYSRQLREEEQKADPSGIYSSYEMTVEVSYGIQMLPGLIIQPGLQVLLHPGSDSQAPAALALGLNAIVSF